MAVVYDATHEIQGSIVFATLIIILVLLPLFFLAGVEGPSAQALGFRVHRLPRRLVARGHHRDAGALCALAAALAAGLALVPLALSGGEPGSEIQTPMAIVILFGLLSSTALNTIVVPALYLRFGSVLRAKKRLSTVRTVTAKIGYKSALNHRMR